MQLTDRQQWLSILTQQKEEINHYAQNLKAKKYDIVRAPEIGMAMVKGKTAGEGQVFNLGEVTVTRCVVRIEGGTMGFGYVVGRNQNQALLIALADAYLQSDEHAAWEKSLLVPLNDSLQKRLKAQENKVQTTKVDFFTMVRGED